ncbi:MAG TPA: 30S ribosomal protein S17 [archaeon]|nr:30S ribosomal protein S17 [archaeon]
MARKKEATKARNIGIDVKPPKEICSDEFCPFHGTLPVRGKVIEGKVVSARAQKTAIIVRQYYQYLSKYERYERRHSRIAAYSPECIAAKTGDIVKIAECRQLSKIKHFVVVEVIQKAGEK